ncbi:MAG TPA: MFS transporter [Chloroflexota bacterium]
MRQPIIGRSLLLVFGATFGTTVSFYLLLSVVPLYATSVGAGQVGAGLSTGVLMFATVAAELVTPALLGRLGYRVVLAAGLVLLGAPALLLPSSDNMIGILTVSAVRGVGFAIAVVVGSALVASIAPPERRGETLGLYGVVVGIPAIVALPLGVLLVNAVGYPTVFVAGAVAALVGLVAVPGLPGRGPRRPGVEQPVGILAALRSASLLRPSIVFSTVAMAAGVIVTFLPLALSNASENLAELGLLVQATASTITRWWAGRHGDRHGSAGLLVPATLVSAVGILALVIGTNAFVVLAGMLLFGAGFGVAQNASLSLMFERVSSTSYGSVSALWNLAYDLGLGVGATAFGIVASGTSYPVAFALTAVVMLAALVPAWQDRSSAASSEA